MATLTKQQEAELHYEPSFVVEFVRKVRGDAAAERVANDFDSLAFWDAKIADWSSD